MEVLNSFLYSIGLSGLFSSRIFLPAFVTAVFLKYGSQWSFLTEKIGFLADIAERAHATDHPIWFTSGPVVIGLGALALVEFFAEKSPEVREVMDEFSAYAKAGVSGLTTMGFLSAADAEYVDRLVQQAGVLDILPAAISAGLTYLGATIRGGILSLLSESDPDDSLKIRSFISWLEDIGIPFVIFYLVAAPIIGALVICGFFGALHFIRERNEAKLEEAKVPCVKCGERIHSFATGCHHCGAEVEKPKILGFLGGIKEETAGSREEQQLRLMRLKRSPLSGERFEGKGVELKCEEDGTTAFSDPKLTAAYIGSVTEKLPKALLICVVLGIVPVIGLIVGVIYYRLRLVAPFRRYLTFGRSFLTKWLLRLALVVLAIAQVSFAGFLAVPAMALLNFWFYRSAFVSALKKAGLNAG
ncbi:MAG: DUF4126 domain-containing protein [Verrucomicrobiota bacterium]